jgi:Na+-transporting methylmalonyl-CoA/oxaloacetate decarboxylase gamma subunit
LSPAKAMTKIIKRITLNGSGIVVFYILFILVYLMQLLSAS